MARKVREGYPDFTAEREAIEANGITPELVSHIIWKHRWNSRYNYKLRMRYSTFREGVPIFQRIPRFHDNYAQLNNQINTDFFSEIIDLKTGYFAGKPITYSYSKTDESIAETGGEEAVKACTKALTDFTTHANIYDVDMQCVKYAAICGYGARLFYIDKPGGKENVMSVFPDQAAIIPQNCEISEPAYGVRYYSMRDIHNHTVYRAEFYDKEFVYYYEGQSFSKLHAVGDPIQHLFGGCPLQGIPNNNELIGDAEKVLASIDSYDRFLSDCSNEMENFSNSYMVFENVNITPEQIVEAQKSGSIQFFSGANNNGKIYYLAKDFSGTWQENYAKRLEDNIRYESGTPNMGDESFGAASGVSLKYKMIPLETKCGMLQAKMQSAGMYMFQLLAGSWNRRKIPCKPEQCTMTFKRNFPLDALSEAQAAQAMIASGLPEQVVYESAYSFIDDVDYVMQLKEQEDGSYSLYQVPEEAAGEDHAV